MHEDILKQQNLIYIFCFLASAFAPYLSILVLSFVLAINGFYDAKSSRILLYATSFIGLVSTIASRGDTLISDDDLRNIYEIYSSYNLGVINFGEIVDKYLGFTEIGNAILFFILKIFFGEMSFRFFLFICACLSVLLFIYLIFSIIDKFEGHEIKGFILSLSIVLFPIILSIHLFRQNIASLFILLGFMEVIRNRKYFLYILAISFHTSSIGFILLLEILKRINSYFVLSIFTIFAVFFSSIYLNSFVDFDSSSFSIYQRYSYLFGIESNSINPAVSGYLKWLLIYFIICLYSYLRTKDFKITQMRLKIIGGLRSIIWLTILSLFFLNFATIPLRINYLYSGLITGVVIGLIISELSKLEKFTIASFFILFNLFEIIIFDNDNSRLWVHYDAFSLIPFESLYKVITATQ